MIWIIGGILGIIGVLSALRWVARSDAAVVAGVFRNLLRIILTGVGIGLIGGRYWLFGLLLKSLFSQNRAWGRDSRGRGRFDQSRYSSGNRRSQQMSIVEAQQILQVDSLASEEEITQAWRKLMRSAHPDMGGKPEDAVRINQARDVLLKNR